MLEEDDCVSQENLGSLQDIEDESDTKSSKSFHSNNSTNPLLKAPILLEDIIDQLRCKSDHQSTRKSVNEQRKSMNTDERDELS
jgi:hypothetical protein